MPILWTISRVLFLVLAAALGGCGGESGPPADELTGSWQATRIEYVGVESGRSIELVAAGGSGSLILSEDGTGILTIEPADRPLILINAPWSLDGSYLTLGTPSNNLNWSVEIRDGTLLLRGANKSYDIDGDGTDDAAKLNLDFTRAP